jgi:hypothetical protein
MAAERRTLFPGNREKNSENENFRDGSGVGSSNMRALSGASLRSALAVDMEIIRSNSEAISTEQGNDRDHGDHRRKALTRARR